MIECRVTREDLRVTELLYQVQPRMRENKFLIYRKKLLKYFMLPFNVQLERFL